MRADDGEDLLADGLPFLLAEIGDEAGREHAIDDAVDPHAMGEGMVPRTKVGEAAIVENRAPAFFAVAMRLFAASIEQRADGGDPWDAIVAHIPDQGQVGAGLQNAGNLRGGPGVVEPVEGRGAAHEIDTAAG